MPHPNKVNEAYRGYPSSQSLIACITMSVVMRLALPLSPKSIAAKLWWKSLGAVCSLTGAPSSVQNRKMEDGGIWLKIAYNNTVNKMQRFFGRESTKC